MRGFLIGVACFLVVVVMIGFSAFGWVSSNYNSFMVTSQGVDAQWGQVENVYQRRFDLIPNLVESTRGIFEQEREVFGAIAKARQHYATAETPQDKIAATNQVESALARLLVVIENYPQLRSSEVVNNLMYEISGTENRITVERQRYNDSALVYNRTIKTFIGRFLASFFGFQEKPYFKAVVGSDVAQKINLSLVGGAK